MSIFTKVPEPISITEDAPKSKQATTCFLPKVGYVRNIRCVIQWLLGEERKWVKDLGTSIM